MTCSIHYYKDELNMANLIFLSHLNKGDFEDFYEKSQLYRQERDAACLYN